MTDLLCTRCGMTATYADAQIADIHESCEVERSVDGRTYHTSEEHKWVARRATGSSQQ